MSIKRSKSQLKDQKNDFNVDLKIKKVKFNQKKLIDFGIFDLFLIEFEQI